jgi:hypothetical protein
MSSLNLSGIASHLILGECQLCKADEGLKRQIIPKICSRPNGSLWSSQNKIPGLLTFTYMLNKTYSLPQLQVAFVPVFWGTYHTLAILLMLKYQSNSKHK